MSEFKNNKHVWEFDKWSEIGKVWVDSGQIVIVDPCKVLSQSEYKKNIVTSKPIEFKGGLITAGWGGDGNFPVFVKKNENGLITEMKIVFNESVPEPYPRDDTIVTLKKGENNDG